MSGDDRNNGRKTLSPEFLPTPASGVVLTPQERVAERARILLQRFRGLGTAAGAAVLSLQCSGYAVVDPLPPPPMQCTVSPNPFTQILVRGMFSTMAGGLPPVTIVLYTNPYPNYVGFRIDAVRVSSGTLVSIQDMTRDDVGGGTEIHITVAPASGATAEIVVDIDVGCGSAVATKRYRVYYQVPASPGGLVVVVEEPASPADAGTD